ncbi:MAG TPA: Nif3-like dinuclear metal center hexameric protein [Bacilli bacterium]|nr:Nif3-like dinuclear metal center hexameric protein [Bacilli bacterium]
MLAKKIIEYLEKRFPRENAEDFDIPRIGLIVGRDDFIVNNILLALDLSVEVVNEAIKNKANFIIIHHPFFFEPMHKILLNTEKGDVAKVLLVNDISVYAMHTNLDVGAGGVNDVLAEKLEIMNIQIANGEVGKHNYLRFGNIKEITLEGLARFVKETFNLTGVKILGDFAQKISKIGVIGGSGAHDFDIECAYQNGCQVLITGEVKLNNAQYAKYLGLNIIEVNHGVEKFVFYKLKKDLEIDLDLKDKVKVSKFETDPLKFFA